MKKINLTPHTINIFTEDGENVANIEPSGLVARIETTTKMVGSDETGVCFYTTAVTGSPVTKTADGDEVPFPAQQNGVIYIVSGMFRMYFDREDLYQPGELLRDQSGRPIGCIGLSR